MSVANIQRIRVVWSNFPGAPGYSNFYAQDTPPNTLNAALRVFFDSVKALVAGSAVFTFPTASDTIDMSNGKIVGQVPLTAVATVTATGSGNFSGGSGAVVDWLTGSFVRGRRLRGRTFLVPLTQGTQDSNGSLATASQTTIQTAATALVTAAGGTMHIYSPPVFEKDPVTGKPTDTVKFTGQSASVLSATVPDLCAILRSRRT